MTPDQTLSKIFKNPNREKEFRQSGSNNITVFEDYTSQVMRVINSLI